METTLIEIINFDDNYIKLKNNNLEITLEKYINLRRLTKLHLIFQYIDEDGYMTSKNYFINGYFTIPYVLYLMNKRKYD